MKTSRIDLIRGRMYRNPPLNQHPRHSRRMSRYRPVSLKVQEKLGTLSVQVRDMFLVTQRKPLEEMEPIWLLRWLLRHYFEWRGFACRSHCGKCDGKCYASIEYRGVFDDKGIAYYAARCPGGAVKPIPFNAALSEETVQYKEGEDAPLSEASSWYRRGVMLPFVTLTRAEIKALEQKVEQTASCAEGKCVAKAI